MWGLSITTIGACLLLLASSASGQCFTKNDGDGHEVAPEALDRLATGSTEFALKLFVNVDKGRKGPNDNVVLSPISVWSGLTATWHGARGKTKQEMEDVLNYGDTNQKRVNPLYHNLTNSLQNNASEWANYTLKLVNRAYIDEKITVRDCIFDYLASEIEKLQLSSNPDQSRKIINQWVEEQTNDKIAELLPDGYIQDKTAMVLVNAIYLKAFWAQMFDPDSTKPGDFFVEPNRPIKVDTMHLPGQQFRIAIRERYSAIELPFLGEDVRMILVVPQFIDVEGFISKLTGPFLKGIFESLETSLVDVWMPKFKVEESVELKNHLMELGIRDLFQEGIADLTGFSPNKTFVEFVRHKARIDVTESGVEAAAATAVVLSLEAIPIPFRVDRPFVFVIHHQKSDAILFLGAIRNPEGTTTQ